jgi:hypothetical protein
MELLGLLFILIIPCAIYLHDVNQYKKTQYYIATKNPYSSIRYNKGINGEYLTYASLHHFEQDGGKFLFNVYLPKNGTDTTEIDIILVCAKGVFVFESKNYSGWIFGNEAHKSWTQTLPSGRGRSHKSSFYNPIKQNATHIRHLKRIIGDDIPTKSIIVFSDACTFKNLTVHSKDIRVVNRRYVARAVADICDNTISDALTQVQVEAIYYRLYPFTQTSDDVRKSHADNIEKY